MEAGTGGELTSWAVTTAATGGGGTGDSLMGEGRYFDLSLGGRSKVDRAAVRGGGIISKEFFHAGADGDIWR